MSYVYWFYMFMLGMGVSFVMVQIDLYLASINLVIQIFLHIFKHLWASIVEFVQMKLISFSIFTRIRLFSPPTWRSGCV